MDFLKRFALLAGGAALGGLIDFLANPASFTEFGMWATLAAAVGAAVVAALKKLRDRYVPSGS